MVLQSHGSLPENHRLPLASSISSLGTLVERPQLVACLTPPLPGPLNHVEFSGTVELSEGNPKGRESRSKIQVLGPLAYLGGLGEMPLSHTVSWLPYLEKNGSNKWSLGVRLRSL